jgi:tetratricopeptide (TPR) repeat protein
MKSRSLTALTTCLAFAAALLLPYVARAQQPPPPAPATGDDGLAQAKSHFEAGKNAYNAGDYQTAIREFKAAEALRPSPILDYNIGLASEKLNRKRVAVKYYKRYLEGMPTASNREQVEASIAQLEREIAAAPPPPAQNAPAQAGQPNDPTAMEPPANQAPPTYSGYDPYAAQQSSYPYQVQPPPKKKRSLWWVPLVIVGGVLLIGTLVAVAVVYSVDTATVVPADHALTQPSRAPPTAQNPSQRSSGLGNILFSF